MSDKKSAPRSPLFSGIAILCLLISLLLAWFAAGRMDEGESMVGYGGLGITVSFMVALLLSGLVTGQIGLVRGEKPIAIPVLALLLNGVIFIAVITHLPR